MKLLAWTIIAIIGVAGIGAVLWLARAPGTDPLPGSERAAARAAEPSAPEVASPGQTAPLAAPAPTFEEHAARTGGSIDDEVAESLLQEETVRDRLYRLALEEEARQRFDESLERSGITAEEIEEGVKQLFETARVEPVLERAGRMDGMVLRSLHGDHPFHRAGFRAGDRLTRLDDWRLDDAGTLPDILIRLQRTFVACGIAEGGEQEVCREVTVDAAG